LLNYAYVIVTNLKQNYTLVKHLHWRNVH